MEPKRTIYDEQPYMSLPIPGTGPSRLALCSLLHGGPLPPLQKFRVLEIGCNDGSNLLPMAFYHPDAEFIGIDRTESALASGRAAATKIGLTNLQLEWMDLNAPNVLRGQFDYILIHGVFSWVDANVRQNILEICATYLAPKGVVYLSHNVEAGWRVRGLVRDVIMDAVAEESTTKGRIYHAREVASSLDDIINKSELPYHQMLAAELQRVRDSSDTYLTHETLAPQNVAFRHDEVVSMMASHGLEYLADALYDRPEGRTPTDLANALGELGTTDVRFEQIADVLGYRRFRSSVFCRTKYRSPEYKNDITTVSLDRIFVAVPTEEMLEGEAFGEAEFTLPADDQFATTLQSLASKQAGGLHLSDLISLLRPMMEPPMDDEKILRHLRVMHVHGKIELSLNPPPEKPSCPDDRVPHSLAKYQAGLGQDPTTASHWPVWMDSVDKLIVVLLGESHTVDKVVKELLRRGTSGDIAISENVDTGNPAWALRAKVKACLHTLGRWGLLDKMVD